MAGLFHFFVLQKRLFVTFHFHTKYSDPSMKTVSHIVLTPTHQYFCVNENLDEKLPTLLTSC